MEKITPHLWFDNEAKEAGTFYTSLFEGSRVKSTTTLHDTPSGSVDIVTIELAGQELTLLSAGPLFKFTPAISFLVSCTSIEEVDRLWSGLSHGGSVLMELGSYPFSERYGWTQDRYGLSWQVLYAGNRPIRQKITPTLMFTEKQSGKAEEAMTFYASVFHDARIDSINRYGAGEEPDREGTVRHAVFTLEGQEFAAMDSAHAHGFGFNEAISLMVHCRTQEEIDYYWDRLSSDPAAEQCGWLKDKYGLAWQIVPDEMDAMLASADQATVARVTEAFLKMKKFDLAKLREAAAGRPQS
ncbi:MAG TPA: VOC family protein [Thermoanaerobaculia bacterium]|jgi:predicted 3-demethylubiquinone-9 3-methyltransferase (glyoxalase superfamily)